MFLKERWEKRLFTGFIETELVYKIKFPPQLKAKLNPKGGSLTTQRVVEGRSHPR